MTLQLPDTTILKETLYQALDYSIAAKLPALIGNPVDNAVFVDGTDKDGLVWVHGIGEDASSAFPATNELAKSELVFGAPVIVQRQVNSWAIIGKDPQQTAKFWKGTNANDQQPVTVSQLMYGTLQPTPPTPSMQVLVIGAMYKQGGVSYRVPDQYTADFSTSPDDTTSTAIDIPTTNTKAIGVLIQLDATTGTLSYKQGAAFDANLSHAQAYDAGYYPAEDADRFRVGYVKLVKGMTTISYEHLYIVPELLTSGGGGGGDAEPLIFSGW